jgi:TFIIF-interacting CTD phosphatase-like protein
MKNNWLVLDWDGTLAYSVLLAAGEVDEANVNKIPTFKGMLSLDRNGTEGMTALFLRPHIKSFLKMTSEKYNLVLWSFGTANYIAECMEMTGFSIYFSKIIVREMMKYPIKDLFYLNLPLNKIAIVDDSNNTFGILNPMNCIDIPTWLPYYDGDRVLKVMDVLIQYHFKNIMSQYDKYNLESKRNDIIRKINSLNQKPKTAVT